ncbi:MAG: helix-turn-helix transcriptional regulator [Ferruginibacter sp.]|nr:helix-turn-helix transcriptional regulator [Ferruginibacter sp.]
MTNITSAWKTYKVPIGYGVCMAVLLFLLKWLELRFIIFSYSLEIYIGAIALIFTLLGIWLARKLSTPKVRHVTIEKELYVERPDNFEPNKSLLSDLAISKRELEVLSLMAEGNSNQEIANRLFVSVSTVKTHNQHLFEKLDVSRRMQAVEKAKKLSLIP